MTGRVGVATAVAAVVGCGAAPPAALTVEGAYAAEPVTAETGAVYFRVVNPLAVPDTLLGADCAIAATAVVHGSRAAGDAGHMHAAGPLPIPARGALQLQPGGLHLMLEGLSRMPRAGDTIAVTLRFARAGAVPVRAPVIPYAEVAERAAAAGRGP